MGCRLEGGEWAAAKVPPEVLSKKSWTAESSCMHVCVCVCVCVHMRAIVYKSVSY